MNEGFRYDWELMKNKDTKVGKLKKITTIEEMVVYMQQHTREANRRVF